MAEVWFANAKDATPNIVVAIMMFVLLCVFIMCDLFMVIY